jgi:hypothetical protein
MPTATPAWPSLSHPSLEATAQTLQLWSQIVGKVRLKATPWVNHSWHATLYVSARGLTTALIHAEPVSFEMEFDFIDSALVIRDTAGRERRVPLASGSVADFYAEVRGSLAALGLEIEINETPNEIADAAPFPQDTAHRVYDPEAAIALWRALVQIDRVFKHFRTGFLGKSSPVHLFWGSLDLAVTRFSGRTAPTHPGGVPNLPDAVTREAYSHEVASAGFWPGGNGVPPSFYAYAYPTPDGFAQAAVRPAEAAFSVTLGEFLLPYEAVRTAADPDAALLDFLQSTYDAAADLANWDRAALDCEHGRPGQPRAV